ncbi:MULTISPECIES: IS5 family transposase [Alphaproteobacteria]|uniref:IS5 family transposase n=1 Tax=Acetobacter fallax TaxID=1737473 RepID=A0ABX0KD08_9PROT|nr:MULTISPECIES: IS5 family transposase [Alphaproteobacteria]MCP1271744.1 IS5 family transposase [Acetobacter cerevisiae]NHO34329.1 IS5 family transposase [Acetobacter fallax]KAA8384850.1 IS5 family transposase [Acetobacter tropicalis]KAA8391522.1 IS5 family transposase [Acetobacter tropicalis]MCP1279697.1 IS5 family transposase [Acetobacter cerevisiae]
MSDVFLLSEHQMERIKPFFPLAHGVPRVDDRRVLSGIVYVIRNGLQWKDAPKAYGPHKTLYNRFIRWSRLGVFDRIFVALTEQAGRSKRLMIDATHLKAHRTAASLLKKGLFPRHIGRTKGGLNSKLHAVCDSQGRPVRLHLTAGQVSDFKGADVLLANLPEETQEILGDRGYDSNKIRQSLADRNITACIPPKKNRKSKPPYDWHLYKKRHLIENMFAKLKDWRRVATRYDRCAHTFMSAIHIAASFIFYLKE